MFHVEYEIEDVASHKLTAARTVDGDVRTATHAIALELDAAANPFSSENPAAIEAWGHGDFERAVQADPGFGTAWGAWAQNLGAAGKQAEGMQIAQRALAEPALRSPVQKAQIQLLLAGWQQNQPGRSAALATLARLTPNDVPVVTEQMAAELRARRYPEAAVLLRRALTLRPGDANLLNSLGYAEGMAGNLEAARVALTAYGKEPGQETNALDSLGEVYFVNGKFTEASRYFQQAYTKDPSFLQGATVVKAAHAEWLSGNLTAADFTLAPYFKALAERHDPSAAWREAVWLYTTGRPDQAVAKLQANPSPLAAQQMSVWKGQITPPKDLATLERLFQSTTALNDGMPRVFYAEALAAAGRNEEARRLMKLWPLPQEGEPVFQSLVFGKFVALRKALGVG